MDEMNTAGALWEQLLRLFPDKREQRLIYLTYNCGLKPMEIVRLCPEEFSSVREVYRLHGSIMDRLQRNLDMLPGLLETGSARAQNL